MYVTTKVVLVAGSMNNNLIKGSKVFNNAGESAIILSDRVNRTLKIKFTETGFERYVRDDHLKSGAFSDTSKINLKGRVINSNGYGAFVVSEDLGGNRVSIEFIDTRNKIDVYRSNAVNGSVKDKLRPTVAGYGYIGKGEFNSRHPSYYLWSSMIKRCYKVSCDGSNISYINKGVKVCDEWLNFQNFASWFDDHIARYSIEYDGKYYDIDKDIIGDGLMYSDDACCIIPREINQLYRDIQYAKGFGLNKHENKKNPFKCSHKGKWIGVFETKNECRKRYGELKLDDLSNIELTCTLNFNRRVLELIRETINKKFL